MFKFATDKSYQIIRLIRSLLSYQTPLITKVNATGQYVTLELNCSTQKLNNQWELYYKALIKHFPGISVVLPQSREHTEMHDYHLLDALITQDIGRLIYNVPEHSHLILPIGKTLFDLIEFTVSFQKENDIYIANLNTLKELTTAYRAHLNERDEYEKDEALRATILPILCKSIGVTPRETENNVPVSTEEINTLIYKAIIKNRKDDLSPEEIHDLALTLGQWEYDKANPTKISLPESKLSSFNHFLGQHPIIFTFLAMGMTIILPGMFIRCLPAIVLNADLENKIIAALQEAGLFAMIYGSLLYSSKLAFDGMRWAYEKSLLEKPAVPFLPSYKGTTQQPYIENSNNQEKTLKHDKTVNYAHN